MDLFTDKFGFESDDLDAVTTELSRVLEMPAELGFNESRGGDYSAFRKPDQLGGRLILYSNRFHDGTEPDIQEEEFPEFGLIFLIEQRDQRIDYKPVIKRMQAFEPIHFYQSRFLGKSEDIEVIFDLARERSNSS